MLGLLYIFLGLFIMSNLIINVRRYKLNSVIMVDLGLLVYYIFPSIRHYYANFFEYTSRLQLFWGRSTKTTYVGFFCITLFYIAFLLGCKLRIVRKKAEADAEKLFFHDEDTSIKKLVYGICLFSGVLLVLYAYLYGGLSVLFSNISDIRGGFITTTSGKYDFLNKLYRCAPFAAFLAIDYWKSGKHRLMVVLSVTLAALIAISTGGRGMMLQFIAVLILGAVLQHGKSLFSPKVVISLIGCAVFFIILYRPLLIASQSIYKFGWEYAFRDFIEAITGSGKYSISSFGDTLNSILNSFDHYSISMETAIAEVSSGNHQPRYFLEYLQVLSSPIPSILLGISKEHSITWYNSLYLSGLPGIIQVPAGIIGEAIYTGGIIWISFYGVLFGMIGKKIDRYFTKIKETVRFASTYYVGLLFVYFGFAIGGDFSSLVNKYLSTFVLILIISVSLKSEKNAVTSGNPTRISYIK